MGLKDTESVWCLEFKATNKRLEGASYKRRRCIYTYFECLEDVKCRNMQQFKNVHIHCNQKIIKVNTVTMKEWIVFTAISQIFAV